jgi:hypothetical protein
VPGEEATTVIPISPAFTADDISNIRRKKSFIHVIGVVRYMNFLNHPTEYHFWYVWRVSYMFDFPVFDGIPNPDFSRWEIHTHPETRRILSEYEEGQKSPN